MKCLTTLCAHVWSVHDELMHVPDCFARLLHSAWLGKKKITATLARAACENCSRAQKSSVWLYQSRCVTVRKIPLSRCGQSHHGHAYRKSLVRRHIQGQNVEIFFRVTPRVIVCLFVFATSTATWPGSLTPRFGKASVPLVEPLPTASTPVPARRAGPVEGLFPDRFNCFGG